MKSRPFDDTGDVSNLDDRLAQAQQEVSDGEYDEEVETEESDKSGEKKTP